MNYFHKKYVKYRIQYIMQDMQILRTRKRSSVPKIGNCLIFLRAGD